MAVGYIPRKALLMSRGVPSGVAKGEGICTPSVSLMDGARDLSKNAAKSMG